MVPSILPMKTDKDPSIDTAPAVRAGTLTAYQGETTTTLNQLSRPGPVARRIKDMPTLIQPRELMERMGVEHVSEDVLLALILRSGRPGTNVQDMARLLLEKYGSLAGMARASTRELATTAGIGPVRAQCIKAALELGRRFAAEAREERTRIRAPADVARYMSGEVRSLDHERVWVLLLDAKGRIQGVPLVVTDGILDASLIHPREVFKEAVRASAASVLVVHNHPSGDPTPSAEDLRITRQLIEAGRVMGIAVTDHVVLGEADVTGDLRHVSMKAQGLVQF